MDDLAREDARIGALLDTLTAEFALTPIVDRAFADQDIYLDGRSFTGCRFRRCRFYVRLGCFEINGRTPMGDCETILEGPAAKAWGLYDGMLRSTIGVVNPPIGRPRRPD